MLIDTGADAAEFKKVDVYYWNKEDDTVYLDPLVFEENAVLVRPESSETYPLKATRALKGVYNINKGYADFKQISILYENEEYSVVKSNTTYGLSVYDYIVLNADMVKDNEFIYE